jgi:hypothetical protein
LRILGEKLLARFMSKINPDNIGEGRKYDLLFIKEKKYAKFEDEFSFKVGRM